MNEWVWSIGGMIRTGENWSTGRKTLYSVGGGWMNEYGTLVEWYWQGNVTDRGMLLTGEWYWQGKTEVLGEKHYTALVVDDWMGMGHWWNDTDRGNWSNWRKTYWQGKTLVLRSATWPTTNPTYSELGLNFGLLGRRPATNPPALC